MPGVGGVMDTSSTATGGSALSGVASSGRGTGSYGISNGGYSSVTDQEMRDRLLADMAGTGTSTGRRRR